MTGPGASIRAAIPEDVPALEALIETSARALSKGFYTDEEIEAAIAHVFGVDSQLIADGTYYLAEDDAGALLGCGGWSRRATLFGGNRFTGRNDSLLDPATDAARIRAFFVAPLAARNGIGRRLLATCESAATLAGFHRFSLMATLPGVPFYTAHGWHPETPVEHRCGATRVRFVPMSKTSLLQK